MTKTIFAALALAGTISATTAEAQIRPEAGVSVRALARFSVQGTAPPPQAELPANVSTPLTEKWAAEARFSVARVPLPVPAAVRTFVGVAVPIRRSAP